MVRYSTAGESHGRALMTIVERVPAGLALSADDIDAELRRRQLGYGRGGRMQIERDRVEIITGVRGGVTLGSPVGLLIRNRDWENWTEQMSPGEISAEPVTRPRPGHADLAGHAKYGHSDLRNVLERASARETAARVAAGAVAAVLLRKVGIWITGFVRSVGDINSAGFPSSLRGASPREAWKRWREMEADHPLRCPDEKAEEQMVRLIDACGEAGDTLGGMVEVVAMGVPPGLGSYARWHDRLDARLAAAVMSIPGIKAVEVGDGFDGARRRGSEVHDPILPGEGRHRWRRPSNRAGGLEGGMSNGETVVVRGAMKPISTLRKALASIDIRDGEPVEAHHERSDVCAVPAAGVVVEAAVALELARSLTEKFGSDSLEEIQAAISWYREARL